MEDKIFNTPFLLFILGMLGILTSCSKKSEETEIVGQWSLTSLVTNCTPADANNLNAFVLADENGCVILKYSSANFTYSTTTCMNLFFKEDNSGYLIGGSPSNLDSVMTVYSIDPEQDNLEICIVNNFCQNYVYDGKEISIELPLGTMNSSECTRTFTYEKK